MNELHAPSVAAVTLGCKLNYAETSAILDRLSSEGWRIVSHADGADMIIVHTCAVTREAERKCRQNIRRIVRRHPGSVVVVVGCYAQLRPGLLASIDGVHAVLGSNDKFDTAWYGRLVGMQASMKPFIRVSDIGSKQEIHAGYSLSNPSERDRTRAFLKIQDGCDYGCAYCTIPLIRGHSRSLSPSVLLDRAHALAASGYREIVLTGVNIGDYRFDRTSLAGLLGMLESVAVDRIRIGSIEPDILDDPLLDVVARSEKIAPHFHVPLQSGSDSVLKAMRRRYTTAAYRQRVERAVSIIPECALGVDVIVGYPGEGRDEFREMFAFIETLPAAYLHVFTCSVRPGTLLASQSVSGERTGVERQEIERRSRLLVELGKSKKAAFVSRFIGREFGILVEESFLDSEGNLRCRGYSANYLHVTATAAKGMTRDGKTLRGKVVPVRPVGMNDDLNLEGILLF